MRLGNPPIRFRNVEMVSERGNVEIGKFGHPQCRKLQLTCTGCKKNLATPECIGNTKSRTFPRECSTFIRIPLGSMTSSLSRPMFDYDPKKDLWPISESLFRVSPLAAAAAPFCPSRPNCVLILPFWTRASALSHDYFLPAGHWSKYLRKTDVKQF